MKKTAVYFMGLLVFSMNAALAYEAITHEEMSERAFDVSVLKTDNKVLQNLGLKSLEEKEEFPNSKGNKKTIAQLFRDGARFEDSLLFIRPIHHFYDPISGEALLPLLAKPSPTWALEDKGQISFPLFQRYSFADGRDYFYRALTATTPEDHDLYFGKTFETLGHVIHHIQDMAQPQHVRLDPHLKLSDADKPDWFFEHGSRYEQYTKDHPDKLTPLFGLYPPVNNKDDTNYLTTARSFWHTAQGGGMGLAEFTNSNFVSAGTNFRGAFRNGGIIAQPNMRYALPAPSPATPSYELANNLLGPDTPTECSPPNNPCVMTFFTSEVKDNYRPQAGGINPKASTASIFDQDLELHGKTVSYPNLDKCTDPNNTDTCERIETGQIFSLNRFNFDEAHKFLIPRAVAYSAGLIDYFFRGRLAAEDVTFTDTGISLRVKNAIDAQKTPARVNEILYATNSNGAAGSLAIAFDYQDSAGKTRYGVSNTVPVRATDILAPGQVSAEAYNFTLTVPSGAKEVNYHLVFRGKLGQEEDAVAWGPADPVSGFLVTSNYLPTDGIASTRAIFKQGGQWRLSEKKNLVAGNIDWKGWYVNGMPTKVLTWQGPKARYFPDPSGDPFTPNIFQNGELFSVAPFQVLGAALMKDADGKEWLIAICRDFGSDVVYRRPNIKSDSPVLYDPITAKDGWQEIGRFPSDLGWNLEIPWFFNGSGTEAQTMRRITKYIFDNSGRLIGLEYGGLDRAKMEIINGTAQRRNLGNFSPIIVSEICEMQYPSSKTCGVDFKIHINHTLSQASGSYIVAVDYNKDAEQLAVISDSRSRVLSFDRLDTSTSACTDFRSAITQSYSSSGQLDLTMGSRSVVVDGTTESDVWTSDVNVSAYTGSGTVNFNFLQKKTEINYLDLRYELSSSKETVVSNTINGSFDGKINDISFPVPVTVVFQDKTTQEIKSTTEKQTIWTQLNDNTATSSLGVGGGAIPSCNGSAVITYIPDYRNIAKMISGSWVFDSGQNLFVSQEYSDQNYAKRYFNYLTDGDPKVVIPVAPDQATYFPIRVYK